jgi:hypothetical protein
MKASLLLIFLISIASCSSPSVKKFKKDHAPIIIQSKTNYIETTNLLKNKMTKCYPQQNAGMGQVEQTVGSVDEKNQLGTVYYEVESELSGHNYLFYVEVLNKDENSSEVHLHGKGDLFRKTKDLAKNIKKWLKGETGICRGNLKV